MIFFRNHRPALGNRSRSNDGFTLLEVLFVLIIIAILSAIAAPAWFRLSANQQVTLARNELRQAIQQAQANAMTQQSAWRFSLRQQADHLEWAVHLNEQDWQDVPTWHPLDANVTLDELDTTLAQKEGVYYVWFGFKGEVKYRLSTVTLTSKYGLSPKHCVVISTLLGYTRDGEEQLYPNDNGRYCY
ncbi:MAG: prepilin-type N-terminal cleavage/methylation domain-containing protein [Leptolyngbya sp. SIO1D8]|nr:prepilin-type N-terminal cleavage/methylation domain-containing protein [Leptolyngbya sp. SIO1D8]